MNKEIILSPEELYFMGRFLQAKYIDYAYVAAMSDVKQNFPLFEKETRNSLVASGFLMEDFSGNLEVDQQVINLLKPIFFGEVETSIDVCKLGEPNTVSVFKFHFYDGITTMVTGHEGKLLIKSIDQIGIKKMVEELLPPGYDATSNIITEATEQTVTRFIAVKSILVGKTSMVKTYIEADAVLYQENEEYIESVSKDMFISDVYAIVKGV